MLQSSAQTGVVRGLFLAIGFLFGVIGAAWYRRYSGMHVMPDSISVFACVAMCIGAMEEFVFRGYFFQRLLPVNPSLAIGFSALAHACYKLALFISPWSHPHPWTFTFFYVSLIAYLLMGVLRYYAKTIWPVVLAHIIFDLLVYAGSLDAPWWVW
jgi:membrane protease YdiL (CAAX protease family)